MEVRAGNKRYYDYYYDYDYGYDYYYGYYYSKVRHHSIVGAGGHRAGRYWLFAKKGIRSQDRA